MAVIKADSIKFLLLFLTLIAILMPNIAENPVILKRRCTTAPGTRKMINPSPR
jgi:hypothetical protein